VTRENIVASSLNVSKFSFRESRFVVEEVACRDIVPNVKAQWVSSSMVGAVEGGLEIAKSQEVKIFSVVEISAPLLVWSSSLLVSALSDMH
jgi:hypothetical protein